MFLILIPDPLSGNTQSNSIDSLKGVLITQKEDTNKVNTLCNLSFAFQLYSPDSCFAYAKQALELAERLDYEKGIFWSEAGIKGALIFIGNFPLELDYAFKAT